VSRVGGAAQTKAMKQVAGRLRLDLAQYRELEAFSAFASDLDAATKRQLERGARTVEVLKQGQYQPMSVEQQVVVIYAVTNGFLDDVPVDQIREWERAFLEYVQAQWPQVGERLRKERELKKDLEEELKRAIAGFKDLRGDGKKDTPSAKGSQPAAAATR
jgi:F-type H+-transporting ATPase subunit alpha